MNVFRQTHSPPRTSEGECRTLVPTLPSAVEDEVDQEYPASVSHQQGQQQTSCPCIDPHDLWGEIEASRSSAEDYLNDYLDLLAARYLDPDEDSHGHSPSAGNVISRLKVFRDGALKDLRKLETQLVYAKALREAGPEKSPASSPGAATWTAACTVSALTVPAKTVAGLWRLYQDYNFEAIRSDVNRLRHAFEHDRPDIDDTSRELLRRSRFDSLQKVLAPV